MRASGPAAILSGFQFPNTPSAFMVGIVGNTPGSDHFETTTGYSG
jgi:hypothetical protein